MMFFRIFSTSTSIPKITLKSDKLIMPWFMLLTLFFSSCVKEQPEVKITSYKNFNEVFDDFCDKMEKRYPLWDLDNSDFYSKKYFYRDKFKELDLNKSQDIEKSVSYFEELTKGLLDNHFQMVFEINPIRGRTINPAFARKKLTGNFSRAYSYIEIDKSYLDPGYKSIIGRYDSSSIIPLELMTGIIDNSIAYFHFNTFSLLKSSQASEEVSSVMDFFFKYSQITSNGSIGIILDVRGNQGGDLADLKFLLSRLIKEKVTFGYYRGKSGSNRLDFSPWFDATILPSTIKNGYDKPIIVLCDRTSASVAESLVLIIRTLPSGYIIGEKTWGATCPVTDPLLFNTGSFTMPGFANVTMSSLAFKYLDMKVYEDIGIEPDTVISSDERLIALRRDNQLEAAIRHIKTNSLK